MTVPGLLAPPSESLAELRAAHAKVADKLTGEYIRLASRVRRMLGCCADRLPLDIRKELAGIVAEIDARERELLDLARQSAEAAIDVLVRQRHEENRRLAREAVERRQGEAGA